MSRAFVNTLRTTSKITTLPPRVCASSSPLARAMLPVGQLRWSSHSPLGAAPANARKPVTINTLQSLYRKNEPITMITAHDFPSAHVADHAGMDMVLVGDSLAMVALGMDDTSEVLLDEMILHCKSVARATKGAFTVCYFVVHSTLLFLYCG
jgi:3-methyl-2-oxobutanoate hydroxymethyltransferase